MVRQSFNSYCKSSIKLPWGGGLFNFLRLRKGVIREEGLIQKSDDKYVYDSWLVPLLDDKEFMKPRRLRQLQRNVAFVSEL